jgi:hypothetical protein
LNRRVLARTESIKRPDQEFATAGIHSIRRGFRAGPADDGTLTVGVAPLPSRWTGPRPIHPHLDVNSDGKAAWHGGPRAEGALSGAFIETQRFTFPQNTSGSEVPARSTTAA